MKKTNLKGYSSNITKFVVSGGIMALAGVSACKKSTSTDSTTVTRADIVELTTDAIKPGTGGFDAQAKTAVAIYVSDWSKFTCGESKDSTVNYSNSNNSIPEYSCSLKWNYELDCNSGIPSQFTFSLTGNTSYISSLMNSADGSNGVFTISDPGVTSSNYSFTGSYVRSGQQSSQVGTSKTFTSSLKMNLSNILISKTTNEIVSGTATVTVTGTSEDGTAFSFGGTITFLGNKQATFNFNSGESYTINWN